MGDLISRRAAIEALGEKPEGNDEWSFGCRSQWEWDTEILKTMPSAQPGCEDAVSRDALDILIEEAQTAWLRGDVLLMYPALKKGLQKIPPVTPEQPGWIPTSERLPEDDVYVLATTAWDDVTIAERYNGDKWFINEGTGNATSDDITAWMPLPAPYRAEGEKNR